MKNFKKVMAVIVAVMVIVATLAVSTVSVSAANTAFEGKKVYVISKFDDESNTGGKGVMDPLGQAMTTVPDEFKDNLPTHALGEYCGTEYVEIVQDGDALGGKAVKIYVGDRYASYDKSKVTIRGLNGEVTIKEADKSKMFLSFYIKVNNIAKIDTNHSGIEVSQKQDQVEYFIPLLGLSNYLNLNQSSLTEGKWVKVEIPFSAIANRAGTGDMKVNMVRVFINNESVPGNTYTDATRPYIMIDELCIVEKEKAANIVGTTDPNASKPSSTTSSGTSGGNVTSSGVNVVGGNNGNGNSNTTSSNTSSTSSTNNTSLPPAASGSLNLKDDSSVASSVEETESTDKADTSSADITEEEDSNLLLWIIIGVAALVVLGGGAVVLILVLKKKPAAVVEAPAAEEPEVDVPTDAE